MAETPLATTDSRGRVLRDLRISVTDRCNFRCPYCMPAEIFGGAYEFLPRPELLTFEEITRVAKSFVELGVEKIRITGGEPLLRRDLPRLIEQLAGLKGVGDLALTTNGVLLADCADSLAAAGLDRVTVSLDSLDDEAFKELNGRNVSVDTVLQGIDAAEKAGLSPIKINCVVVRNVNDDTVTDLARYFRERGQTVRFIEYMDVGNSNDWDPSDVVTAGEIRERVAAVHAIEPVEAAYTGEVAARYRYTDHSGEIGIISSVSAPFCGGCTRARLSSDGRIFTCLFGTAGTDTKTPLRNGIDDEGLRELIAGVWSRRNDRYSEIRNEQRLARDARKKVEMSEIGG